MKRRIPAGDGVYNLAVTRDGKLLVATNKRGQSVSIIDIATGKELARVPTQRRVVHGVAISSDDRYAFISVEGVGSEPGTVEMIDLRTMQRVASVDVGQMAGGYRRAEVMVIPSGVAGRLSFRAEARSAGGEGSLSSRPGDPLARDGDSSPPRCALRSG